MNDWVLSEEDRCKLWKEHIEKIINEELGSFIMVVGGPVERVTRKEVAEVIKMKRGKAAG